MGERNDELRREARRLLDEHMSTLRKRSYDSLRKQFAGEGQAETVYGRDRTEYQIETQSFMDDKKTGRLCVAAGIDGGSVSATRPLSDSFLIGRSIR